MPNTQSNLTSNTNVIHEAFLVSELSENLAIGLSSEKDTLAQIELANVTVRRRFGRKVLMLDVIDKTEFAELQGRPQARERLKIPLGHTATIGRDRLNLPLLQSQLTISDSHLELSYMRTDQGDTLAIHDYGSVNGSHIAGRGDHTPSWRDRINELSKDETYHHHTDTAVANESYDFLFSDTYERYPALTPKTTL